MPLLDNIIENIKKNHLLIILILILILFLYINNTSNTPKTQTTTNITGKTSTQINEQNNIYRKEKFENKNKFVVFYTTWCGWSRKALDTLNQPEMKKFFSEPNNNVDLVLVDCESKDGREQCDKHNVEGFPTMKLLKSNGKDIVYNGERTPEAIINFIKNN